MHKLAILQVCGIAILQIISNNLNQASIEYMRYLEQCLSDLKAAGIVPLKLEAL